MVSELPKVTKALILVGGFGTRLRPLTFSMPKPLVPFGNLPMIVHQLVALRDVGVTTVILAVAYRPELMEAAMDVWAKKLGINIIYSIEDTPLGTAGPLALAEKHLTEDPSPFFVLNSDVTCDFDLTSLLATHVKSKAEGTVLVTRVADPSRFGVVVHDAATLQVDRFVEKPQSYVGDCINAGIYVLEPSVIKRIPRNADNSPRPTSIERVVFPAIAADKRLFVHKLEGFWMDLGKPADFVDGLALYLEHLHRAPRVSQSLAQSRLLADDDASAASRPFTVVGRVLMHESATVEAGAVIGPNVALGADVKVGPNARISSAAVLDGASIGAGAFVDKSIVGTSAVVQRWARLTAGTVLGASVVVKETVSLEHVHASPQIGIGQSYAKLDDGSARCINC